ncbi:MAG: DUF2027 domain-containing protein [Bacteroidales bacterium]|jgi:hypothetical protein|nr:DUF2027 domain-containing protein [Bacteroidales bacterium]
MRFRKGDKVKFLNDVGVGTITNIIDKKTVNVLTKDGFEVPYLVGDLLKIETAMNDAFSDDLQSDNDDDFNVNDNFRDSEIENEIEEDSTEFNQEHVDDVSGDLFFAFVPENQKNPPDGIVNTYLINDSSYRLMYLISKNELPYRRLIVSGELEDNTKIILNKYNFDDLKDIDELHFQVLFFCKGSYRHRKPIVKSWKIKSTKFYKDSVFSENDYFHENAYLYNMSARDVSEDSYNISNSEIKKQISEKEKPSSRKEYMSARSGKKQDVLEVDLHIEELVDDYRELSNTEIIEIQKARFSTVLDGEIIAGTKKVVFIHGVGNGRLKLEIRKLLQRKYPKLRYQDASFKEYGYGATMVIIK